jgi:hypothetical protein
MPDMIQGDATPAMSSCHPKSVILSLSKDDGRYAYPRLSKGRRIVRLITDAGYTPHRRNTRYELI